MGVGLEIAALPSTVLVVDDEPVVLSILERVIGGRGLPFHPAASGEEAIGAIESLGVGAALVDKNMPGVDGIQVVRELRKRQPYCACIVMTAYASTESVVEALRLGATDYLEKPFPDVERVGEKVEAAIRHRRTEYQRDQFLERIRLFQAELSDRQRRVEGQATEIAMFNEIIELRVKQATQDLRKKCDLVESTLTSNEGWGYAAALHAESILQEVRSAQADATLPAAALGRVSRIVRMLEAHLGLLRRLGAASGAGVEPAAGAPPAGDLPPHGPRGS